MQIFIFFPEGKACYIYLEKWWVDYKLHCKLYLAHGLTKRNEGDTTLYFVSVRYICLLVPACLRLCVMQNVQDSMDDIVDKE